MTNEETLGDNIHDIPVVVYRTEELKTKESLESFAELLLIVKEKLYDVGSVLDDIIDMPEHQP